MRIITHIKPHLDDICAAWLLRRYSADHQDAELEFVATDKDGGRAHDDLNTTCVGIGRGKFDEHKGDLDDCAATLIYKSLVGGAPWPPAERKAIEKIVNWVKLEDTGKLVAEPRHEFGIPAMLRGHYLAMGRDSVEAAKLGFIVLDALLEISREQVRLDADWEGRTEFTSRWGQAVALETDARDADAYAYGRGFVLVVLSDPEDGYLSGRVPADSSVDLTAAYDTLRQREPNADWYLHHSKKMLICGGDVAPDSQRSQIKPADLIELLK